TPGCPRSVVSSPDVLGDPRLRSLWEAAHRRLEAVGAAGDLTGADVHLRGLSSDQRVAIDRLVGTRSRGATLRLPLDRLDRRLRDRTGRTLTAVVTDLVGPLRDRPGERIALDATWVRLAGHLAVARDLRLEAWLATTRWRSAPDDVAAALDVLLRLPQTARVGRTRLAGRVLHDAHALDPDQPAGRLVLSALAFRAGVPVAGLRAADRRRLWADQGVLSDETSSTALTLGLCPLPAGPLTEAAARWAEAGVPLPVPLVAVQAEAWRVAPGTLVSVCENPSVLAAAGAGPAMVCVEGRPRLAATLLLRSLAAGGARLRYHGDFGAGGISIANGIIGDLGAEPWRMGAGDYRAALDRAATARLRPLRGAVPEACWDQVLATVVRAAGVEVEEELVIEALLDDLDSGQ
ncbi:MAG: TIGR02679 family protein, partial [Acidimicrobiales bacterium]